MVTTLDLKIHQRFRVATWKGKMSESQKSGLIQSKWIYSYSYHQCHSTFWRHFGCNQEGENQAQHDCVFTLVQKSPVAGLGRSISLPYISPASRLLFRQGRLQNGLTSKFHRFFHFVQCPPCLYKVVIIHLKVREETAWLSCSHLPSPNHRSLLFIQN